jgi:hypothetical protein
MGFRKQLITLSFRNHHFRNEICAYNLSDINHAHNFRKTIHIEQLKFSLNLIVWHICNNLNSKLQLSIHISCNNSNVYNSQNDYDNVRIIVTIASTSM